MTELRIDEDFDALEYGPPASNPSEFQTPSFRRPVSLLLLPLAVYSQMTADYITLTETTISLNVPPIFIIREHPVFRPIWATFYVVDKSLFQKPAHVLKTQDTKCPPAQWTVLSHTPAQMYSNRCSQPTANHGNTINSINMRSTVSNRPLACRLIIIELHIQKVQDSNLGPKTCCLKIPSRLCRVLSK